MNVSDDVQSGEDLLGSGRCFIARSNNDGSKTISQLTTEAIDLSDTIFRGHIEHRSVSNLVDDTKEKSSSVKVHNKSAHGKIDTLRRNGP